MKNNSVAAIVVTYNRLNLLKKCIDGLRSQSNKNFDVIVINNGSSDGTYEWLEEQQDLIVLNQDNLGGAGGFYAGMKKAYEDGYEWIWMMDDDGLADKYQLEKLLEGAKFVNSLFVNALVCDINDNEMLSFGLDFDGNHLSTTKGAKKFKSIPFSINPFNGTLIHKSIIDKIGFIKKEMFIWGDEVEYTKRAQKAGFEHYTITDAIHYHPKYKAQKDYVLPFIKKGLCVVPANKERAFIKYRNEGYLCKTYYPQVLWQAVLRYLSRVRIPVLATCLSAPTLSCM